MHCSFPPARLIRYCPVRPITAKKNQREPMRSLSLAATSKRASVFAAWVLVVARHQQFDPKHHCTNILSVLRLPIHTLSISMALQSCSILVRMGLACNDRFFEENVVLKTQHSNSNATPGLAGRRRNLYTKSPTFREMVFAC